MKVGPVGRDIRIFDELDDVSLRVLGEDDEDARAANARENVKSIAPRPIYLVHCKGDEHLTYRHSELIAESAAGAAELLLVDGGSHFFAGIDRPALFEQFIRWMTA